MDDKGLISKAIEASGLSVRQFARQVLVREPRTVWRWLAGENALPAAVRTLCQEIVEDPPALPEGTKPLAKRGDE